MDGSMPTMSSDLGAHNIVPGSTSNAPQQHMPSTNHNSTSNILQTAVGPDTPPVKRRPGRPKGSGKKPPLDNVDHLPDKVKRPVGRPRKDGLPAGSVGPRRSNRPRKSPGKVNPPTSVSASQPPATPGPVPFPGAYYPQHPGIPSHWQAGFPVGPMQPSISAPAMGTISNGSTHLASSAQPMYNIDPSLNRDEWAELLRTKPNIFMQTLLSALSAPNPISTAGPTVEEAFKSHLVSLAPTATQNKEAHSIPSLYSILKTFWLPSSPSYFSLTASASTARTPSEHRFLYWDPQPLVFNGIACPSCSTPLVNRGRIRSGPIKVYDLEKPFFIIGCEYACKSSMCNANTNAEGRRFASTDASILRALPVRLKDEFPAHLLQGDTDMGSGTNVWNWHAMGVSLSLWNMVKGCLKAGMGREAVLHIIRAIQNGVPDDTEKEEEEEEDIEEEPEQDIHDDGEELMQDDDAGPSHNANNTSDEYNDAWKANSVVADAGATNAPQTSASANGSHAAHDMSTPQPVAAAQPQQFTFAQPGPYVSYPYPPYPYYPHAMEQPPNPPPPDNSTPEQNSLKRPFGFGDNPGSEVAILEPSQKRTRHCCKCGSQDCKGKGGRSFCLSACQDCGKVDCRGRNSRRPDKVCSEAWT